MRIGRVLGLLVPVCVISTWLIADAYVDRQAKARETRTLTTGKMLSIAAMQYEEDHNGRLPSAANWEQEIRPYLGNVRIEVENPIGSHRAHRFAINSHIAGHNITELLSPAEAVLFFESTAIGPNAADEIKSMPTKDDGSMVVTVIYADGHGYNHPLDAWREWSKRGEFVRETRGELQ